MCVMIVTWSALALSLVALASNVIAVRHNLAVRKQMHRIIEEVDELLGHGQGDRPRQP
jgi:hypothetical protein